MRNSRTIELLEDRLKLFAEREKEHLKLIREQTGQIRLLSEKIEQLSVLLTENNKTIGSLEDSLLQKEKSITSLSGKNRGLSKLLGNASEKIAAESDSPEDTQKKAPTPKERGNNNAVRKEHFKLDVENVEVWPGDPAFDKSKAHVIGHLDSIRYSYIPPRFIKKIIRQYNCAIGDQVFCAYAPRTPQMNSNYDASFIAGIINLRFIYSMPVERIIKQFTESGFELNKPTAYGLLCKTSIQLECFYDVLRKAIHSDPYIRMDETYHNVLVEEKNSKGKGIRKGYFRSAMAEHLQLIHFFYRNGSREKAMLTDYLDESYSGAVHTDGYSCYRKIQTDSYPNAIRLSCAQHVKRKFFDLEKDEQAKDIVDTINKLYRIEHRIPPDLTPEKKLKERNKKAPPILKELKAKLQAIKDDPLTLPSGPLADAVNYTLNEFDTIKNYLLNPDYTLDNNPNEKINRYISISRRNSLFFGSHDSASRAALIYSLACSCRLHDINVFEYFNDILTRMPYLPPKPKYEVLRELLPDRWKKLSDQQVKELHASVY
jgi:Transposase IS66 family.